jgi:hypothetical protein
MKQKKRFQKMTNACNGMSLDTLKYRANLVKQANKSKAFLKKKLNLLKT